MSVAFQHYPDPSCDLCGLPAHAPLSAEIGGAARTFCCGGCRQVYQILVESDQITDGQDPTQTTLYQQCLQMGLIARPEEPHLASPSQGEGHETSPRLSFTRRGIGEERNSLTPSPYGGEGRGEVPSHGPDSLETTREAAFQIGGMWCASCAWLIEHALGQIKGVESCRVFFASDIVKVIYKPARVSTEALSATIQKLGYTAQAYGGDNADNSQVKARRALFIRTVIACIFAANAMMFQLPFYADFFQRQGLPPDALHMLPRWQLFLSLPVLIAGWPIFAKALNAARRGTATMETLIALGSGTAFLYSIWTLVQGGNHVYFDTADMLLALVLVGKHIEAGAKSDATGAIALLYGLLPRKALRVGPDGRETPIAVEKLGVGDCVMVRPGERIPCDGVVFDGAALADESLLSGESRPVAKRVGSPVTGGTVATDAPLVVEVTRVGTDTTLSQMITLVEEALAAKSPVERWADGISRRFVPAIILLALVSGLTVFAGHHNLADSVLRTVAVLVIACPCALALATPLALTTGVGIAASRGILIANPDILQTLPRVRHVLLDKTGTLTEGRFAVREFTGDTAELAALAALENASEHPLSRAIIAYARAQNCGSPPVVHEFTRHEGAGVTGLIHGETWFIGNRALCAAQQAAIPDCLEQQAQAAESLGHTTLFYGISPPLLGVEGQDGSLRGLMTLGDALRPGAAEAVRRLQAVGLSVEVISGDAAPTTQAIARTVGIVQSTAQMRPAEKVARVRAIQEPNPAVRTAVPSPLGKGLGIGFVAMVGDGINDAPALAQADVGIAFGSGTEIARRAADITLVGDDLGRLADVFTLSRQTARVIRQNLFWACLYNAVCIPLAVAGLIHPIIASAAMLVSSLSVVLNTKRLRRQLERF